MNFNLFQLAQNEDDLLELDNFFTAAMNLDEYDGFYVSYGMVNGVETKFSNNAVSGLMSASALKHFENAYWNGNESFLAVTLTLTEFGEFEENDTNTSYVFHSDNSDTEGTLSVYKVKTSFLNTMFYNSKASFVESFTDKEILAYAALATELEHSLDQFITNRNLF